MLPRPARSSFAPLALAAVAAAAGPALAAAQDGAAGSSNRVWHEEFQEPLRGTTVFHVSGGAAEGDPSGNLFLDSVEYANGEVYDDFYTPNGIFDFEAEEGHGERLRIRAASRVDVAQPGFRTLGGYGEGVPSAAFSDADRNGFAAELNRVVASPNLAYYLETQFTSKGLGEVGFSYTVDFSTLSLLDNDPGPDEVGELLLFERGGGDGNSWISIQAVDAAGEPLGEALALGLEDTRATTPRNVLHNDRQHMGVVAIDLSRLGVSELTHLRVRSTRATDSGYMQIASHFAVDHEPDHKFLYVKTHPMHRRANTWYD